MSETHVLPRTTLHRATKMPCTIVAMFGNICCGGCKQRLDTIIEQLIAKIFAKFTYNGTALSFSLVLECYKFNDTNDPCSVLFMCVQ